MYSDLLAPTRDWFAGTAATDTDDIMTTFSNLTVGQYGTAPTVSVVRCPPFRSRIRPLAQTPLVSICCGFIVGPTINPQQIEQFEFEL